MTIYTGSSFIYVCSSIKEGSKEGKNLTSKENTGFSPFLIQRVHHRGGRQYLLEEEGIIRLKEREIVKWKSNIRFLETTWFLKSILSTRPSGFGIPVYTTQEKIVWSLKTDMVWVLTFTLKNKWKTSCLSKLLFSIGFHDIKLSLMPGYST